MVVCGGYFTNMKTMALYDDSSDMLKEDKLEAILAILRRQEFARRLARGIRITLLLAVVVLYYLFLHGTIGVAWLDNAKTFAETQLKSIVVPLAQDMVKDIAGGNMRVNIPSASAPSGSDSAVSPDMLRMAQAIQSNPALAKQIMDLINANTKK